MTTPMLEIRDLHATAGETLILKGIDLVIQPGEVHAVMGPNGSGKSTLANVLAGKPGYEIVSGQVLFEGRDLSVLAPEERAREGIFLAFQYPVEIPGVSNMYFLKQAVNAVRTHRGIEELDAMEFLQLAREKMKLVEMSDALMSARSTRASPAARRSATRSSRWRCSIRSSPCSTRPTRASTSTRCASSRTASTRCAARRARCSSSRTTSACSITSCPTASTCSPAAAS